MKKRWNGSLWKRKPRVLHMSMSDYVDALLKEQRAESKTQKAQMDAMYAQRGAR